jgi:hypothetical protein
MQRFEMSLPMTGYQASRPSAVSRVGIPDCLVPETSAFSCHALSRNWNGVIDGNLLCFGNLCTDKIFS